MVTTSVTVTLEQNAGVKQPPDLATQLPQQPSPQPMVDNTAPQPAMVMMCWQR